MICLDSLKPLIFQAFGYPKTSHLLMFCLLWIQTLSSMFRFIPPTLTLTPKKGEAPAKNRNTLVKPAQRSKCQECSRQVSAMKVFRHLVWVEEIFSIAPHSGKTNSFLDMALLKPSTTCFIWPNEASSCFYTFWIQETVWGHLGRRVRTMPAWHGGLSFARSHGNHFTSVIVPNPHYGGGGKSCQDILSVCLAIHQFTTPSTWWNWFIRIYQITYFQITFMFPHTLVLSQI